MSASLPAGFARLMGMKASDEEVRRLVEVKEALGLADNDALWLVLIALEHYDALYRTYPARIAEEARRTLADVQQGFAAAAAIESKRAQRKLSEAVAAASIKIASKRVDSMRVQGFAAAAASMVIFGALCLAIGCALGSSRFPPWSHGSGATRILSAALGAPAGWMVILLLLPAGWVCVKRGWAAAHAPIATTKEKGKGWASVALGVISVAALAIAVLRMM